MATRKPRRARIDDATWIRRHFEELVDKYGGRYIIVASGEVFVVDDVVKVEAEARRKHPGVMPIGMPVPRPEDFQCAL